MDLSLAMAPLAMAPLAMAPSAFQPVVYVRVKQCNDCKLAEVTDVTLTGQQVLGSTTLCTSRCNGLHRCCLSNCCMGSTRCCFL